jgi:hypothetical protein
MSFLPLSGCLWQQENVKKKEFELECGRATVRQAAAATVGLRAAGEPAAASSDQHALQRSLGAAAQLFSAFDEAAQEVARG